MDNTSLINLKVNLTLLNFRVRDGNGWTLALISTNYIAAAFAVTTIIFTFPLSVKRKMVTRTGFEPMLKA